MRACFDTIADHFLRLPIPWPHLFVSGYRRVYIKLYYNSPFRFNFLIIDFFQRFFSYSVGYFMSDSLYF